MRMYELPKPPPELAHDLPQDLFTKAQQYGLDKTRYNVAKTVVDQIFSLYLIRSGAYSRAWDQAGVVADAFGFGGEYTVSLVLVWRGRCPARWEERLGRVVVKEGDDAYGRCDWVIQVENRRQKDIHMRGILCAPYPRTNCGQGFKIALLG